MNILFWIIGIIASLFGIQTMRIEKAKKKTKEAESQLVYEQGKVEKRATGGKSKRRSNFETKSSKQVVKGRKCCKNRKNGGLTPMMKKKK